MLSTSSLVSNIAPWWIVVSMVVLRSAFSVLGSSFFVLNGERRTENVVIIRYLLRLAPGEASASRADSPSAARQALRADSPCAADSPASRRASGCGGDRDGR